MEKKLRANQKIAQERIWRLFELAQKNEEYSKRYVELAREIGRKLNVKIPQELKEKYCKKCNSTKVSTKKEEGIVIIKCRECGASRMCGEKKLTKEKKENTKKQNKSGEKRKEKANKNN